HVAGIRAMVGFGQAEAAYPLAAGQLGQVFALLFFTAEFSDGHHHQRGLHTHHGAVARIDAFDFAGDQAVADIVQPGAAVFFGNGGAQQAQFTHFGKDGGVCFLVAEGLKDSGCKLVLGVGLGGVAHHALFLGKLGVQQKRVLPVEGGGCRHRNAPVQKWIQRWKTAWPAVPARLCVSFTTGPPGPVRESSARWSMAKWFRDRSGSAVWLVCRWPGLVRRRERTARSFRRVRHGRRRPVRRRRNRDSATLWRTGARGSGAPGACVWCRTCRYRS